MNDVILKLKYRPFEAAMEFARSQKLKNEVEWDRYCKSGKKPVDIPTHPDRTYKNSGWAGWGTWLGYDPNLGG